MNKKLILSLLCTLIIAANVNCTNAYAHSRSHSKSDNPKGIVLDKNMPIDKDTLDSDVIDKDTPDSDVIDNDTLDSDVIDDILDSDVIGNILDSGVFDNDMLDNNIFDDMLDNDIFNTIFSNTNIRDYFKGTDGIIKENAKEIEDTLLYQLYIEEVWDGLEVEKDMDLYNSNDKSLGKPGDILIAAIDTSNTDISAIKRGSLTTHAAFVDSDPKKVLELLQDGILNCENDWRTRYKKVLVLRPNVDEKVISDAIAFGHTKIGTPFSYFSNLFDKTNTDKFYCSQFVWNCYLNAGVDLDGNGGMAVFPNDLVRSDKVSIVYKQGE